jgi:ribonuclease P protein component
LRRPSEIAEVKRTGVCTRGEFVTMYLAASDAYRFGVIAGRRVGIAVQRNRARRILREALRALRPRLRGDRGGAILLAARSAAVAARTQQVTRDLAALLAAHRLLVPESSSGS